MKIAICSDEPYSVHETVIREVERRGHTIVRFGSVASEKEERWACVAREASEAIMRGECDEGIFLCWTGTGISMAANKVPGIRAALCTDAETAKGARIWNHANVLAMSNRLITADLAKEILAVWFDTPFDPRGKEGVSELNSIDKSYRSNASVMGE